jgi:hypothetical protein
LITSGATGIGLETAFHIEGMPINRVLFLTRHR